MKPCKYFDWALQKPITDRDGCPLEAWVAGARDAAFGVHPKGFRVFLRPPDLEALDEYAGGDPYAVEVDDPFHRRRLEATLALLARGLTAEGPRVLDCGCGEGHITGAIQRAFPGAEVSGLDCSSSAIARAVGRHPAIDFIVADAYHPPYARDYFDAVVCNNLWEHVPDPLRLLGAVARVLKPGGIVVLSTPSRYRLQNLLRVVRGRPAVLVSRHHVTEYSVGQVIEQLRWGGFAVEAIEGKPLRRAGGGLKAFVSERLILPLVSAWLRCVKSHHSLASTVFFLARREAKETETDPGPGSPQRSPQQP